MRLPVTEVAGIGYYDGYTYGFVQDANGEWFAFALLDWDSGDRRVFGFAGGEAGAIARALAALAAAPRNWWPDEAATLRGEEGMHPEACEASRLFDAAWATVGEVLELCLARADVLEAKVLHAAPPELRAKRLPDVMHWLCYLDDANAVDDTPLIRWIEAGGDPL